MIGSAKGSVGSAQKRVHDVARYPAPVGGIDLTRALGDSNLNTCIYTYNMVPYEYGLRVRQGYREWQIGVDAGGGVGVHTLIPFESSSTDGSGSKLFAVNNEGIWDVTADGGTPAQVVTFGNQGSDAGYGTYASYIDTAENDILFYADSLNGLYSYTAATNTWTNTGIFTTTPPIVESEVTSVMTYKNNVWFTVRDSTVGYYLPLLSSTGLPVAQYFGDKFKHGGVLVGLFSWTVDGGDGVNDILVAVSNAGDVLMYSGSGPGGSDWAITGSYYIGTVPNTPRFGSEQGGELYLLSVYGLTSMSDLLQGVDTATLQADAGGSSITSKIAGLLRLDMDDRRTARGWGVAKIPSEGGLLVSTPTVGSAAPIQYYYNLGTKGWGIWRDVPMECFAEHNDTVFFGGADGRVHAMDVTVDNVLITPLPDVDNGDDISFSILTAFTSLGADGVYKGVKLIRPDFISSYPTGYSSQARYDYDQTEGLLQGVTDPISGISFAGWDLSEWDVTLWGEESEGIPLLYIGGGWGTGRYVAIATKGTCRTRTRLIGWDIVYTAGGPMI